MKRALIPVVIVVLLLSTLLQVSVHGQVFESMSISMAGQPATRIVAGIVHNITVTLDGSYYDVTLRMRLSGGVSNASYLNNYSWTYSSDLWTDDVYDYYIKNESARYGNDYCFYVALDSSATPGTWNVSILVNGTLEHRTTIMVEKPVAGISMSAPTFYFRIMPYGTGYINSWNPDDPNNSTSLTTRNIGNVPLDFSITYDRLNGLFGTTNSTGIYMPGEERTHYVDFQAQSWSPRKFKVKGLINGNPLLVITPNTVSCIVAPSTTFDVVVTVARQGYDVYQMEGVTVQYKRYYASKYTETLTLDMYLSGNRSVYISGRGDGVTFDNIYYQGQEFTVPLLLNLTDNAETYVQGNITCDVPPPEGKPSMLAYVMFDLELDDRSVAGHFNSTVVVGASTAEPPDDHTGPSILVVGILVGTFVAIGAFLFVMHRRAEEERRRQLEERIRKKKERARRQRSRK